MIHFELNDRTIVVTGGSSGTGRALAAARSGALVVVAGSNEARSRR